jgi:hypothetical protein
MQYYTCQINLQESIVICASHECPSQLVSRSTALSHPDTMFQIYFVSGILVAVCKRVDMSNGLSSYQAIGRPIAKPQLEISTPAPSMAQVLPCIHYTDAS